MKFEKKVIIGSITSFIITAVGIVAVFFPDLLNLQKEKIERYEATISNKKEAIEFSNFLEKISKKEKLFYLDVAFCIPYGINPVTREEEELYWVDNYYNANTFFDGENETFVFTVKKSDYEPEDAETCKTDDFNNPEYFSQCGQSEYYFKNIKETENYHDMLRGQIYTIYKGKEGNKCYDIFEMPDRKVINGYFIPNGDSFYKNSTAYSFEPIDKKEIKLKSY